MVKDDNLIIASRKWLGHNVLLDVGISFKYAGKEFAEKHLQMAFAKKQLEENTGQIKTEEMEELSSNIKSEPGEEPSTMKPEEKFVILDPVAGAQVGLRERELKEKALFANLTGPSCRALSLRRDLKLRRHLCGLPENSLGPPSRMKVNEDLRKQAFDLFNQSRLLSKQIAPAITVE